MPSSAFVHHKPYDHSLAAVKQEGWDVLEQSQLLEGVGSTQICKSATVQHVCTICRELDSHWLMTGYKHCNWPHNVVTECLS